MQNNENQQQQAQEEQKREEEAPLEFDMCFKEHPCGHLCKGVAGESECLPCLNEDCQRELIELGMQFAETDEEKAYVQKSSLFNAGEDELCGICFTSELGSEACVRTQCRHVFHAGCLAQMLKHKYGTLKITFGFLDCPSCKQEFFIDYVVPRLTPMLTEALQFKAKVEEMAIKKAQEEGLHESGPVVDVGSYYFGKLQELAMHQCTFYECAKCQTVYFGGLQDCADAMGLEQNTKKEDLLCKECKYAALGLGKDMCEEHGNDYVDFKCKYCCSVAMFICCGGNEYFCQPCHNDAMNHGKHKAQSDCEGGPNCPLAIPYHPKAERDSKNSAFALGCSLCRSKNLQKIANKEGGSGGFNVEQRADMKKRFDHVLGHDKQREMRIEAGRPQAAQQIEVR